MRKKAALIFVMCVCGFTKGHGQLSGYNLMEYQFGNHPDDEPNDMSGLYDQLNLSYRQNHLTLNARFEQFYNSHFETRNYFKLTQYRAEYRKKGFSLNVGHVDETLGNGILFRNFEIPGSIYESRGWRVKYGFYRDLTGASLFYRHKSFTVKAIRGYSLNNLFPPTESESLRRKDLVEAVEATVNIRNQTPGLILMRHFFDDKSTTYISLFGDGKLPGEVFYSFEYAQKVNNQNLFQIHGEDNRGAIYVSLNKSFSKVGISAEYKDYHQMFMGTGISDPPTLVKEHGYVLLNRSTHQPELDGEKGYQLEVYVNLFKNQILTLNHSMAEVTLTPGFLFWEYFAEYYAPLEEASFKLFADVAQDELRFENRRLTGGITSSYSIDYPWSIELSAEYQNIERKALGLSGIDNLAAQVTVSKSTEFSVGLYYEFTNDPFIADRTQTAEVEGSRHYFGVNSGIRRENNSLQVFVGERRGGPACTSGICYEVLDFRGIELRFKTNF